MIAGDKLFGLPMKTVSPSLIADNQAVTIADETMVLITSDNTTAANRTFTLSNPSYDGQLLWLTIISAGATTCELADSGNCALSAAWTPQQFDTLLLIGYATGTKWLEVTRADN